MGKTEKARKENCSTPGRPFRCKQARLLSSCISVQSGFKTKGCCWRTRAPSHDNISEGLGAEWGGHRGPLSLTRPASKAASAVPLSTDEISQTSPTKTQMFAFIGPSDSASHSNTYWNEGEKIEAPPLESLGPQEETGGGTEGSRRSRLEIAYLLRIAAKKAASGAGTEETDGEERDQSDRVARQQHIIKEKVWRKRLAGAAPVSSSATCE